MTDYMIKTESAYGSSREQIKADFVAVRKDSEDKNTYNLGDSFFKGLKEGSGILLSTDTYLNSLAIDFSK